jgi:hypothetical protein
MPKRENASTGRRPSPGASPVRAGRVHSAGAKSVETFTARFDEQWQAIRSIHDWPVGTDWRGEIERIGRDYWEAQTTREMWVKRLHGKQPAKQRKKIEQALVSIRQSQKALTVPVDNGRLLDDDFPHPNLSHPEHCLKEWLSDYDLWVRPFAGKRNPIQAELEGRLINCWKRSGGKPGYSRKKEKHLLIGAQTGRGAAARDARQDHADAERPNTPYAPLVDFLTLTLNAILGKALKPSGVAKVIDRHRGQRQRHIPYLMLPMRLRIWGIIDAAPLWD